MNIYYNRTTDRTFHFLRFARVRENGKVTYVPRIDYDTESELWVTALLKKSVEDIANEVLGHYGLKPRNCQRLCFYVGE